MKKNTLLLSMFLLGTLSLFLPNQSASALSLLQKPSSVQKKPITSLPIDDKDVPRNITDTILQMPVAGDNRGRVTQEISVYDAKRTLSVVYHQGIKVTQTSDDEPFYGQIFPPQKIPSYRLPQPRVTGATLLAGVLLSADEPLTFSAPATLRFPLPEQQYGNTDIAVYFVSEEEGAEYILLESESISDGKGILVPVERTGYYTFFTEQGDIPSTDSDEGNKEREEEEPQFTIYNPYKDVSRHWAKPFIEKINRAGIAPLGSNALLYAPDTPATRSDMAYLVAQWKFRRSEINKCLSSKEEGAAGVFPDVPVSHYAAQHICILSRNGLVNGLSGGIFAPDKPLGRAEALTFLYKAIGEGVYLSSSDSLRVFSDVSENDWFHAVVMRGVQEGVVTGFFEKNPILSYISAKKLYKNDRSIHVTNLQQILSALGFYTGEISGILEQKVSEGVSDYQVSRGIISDLNSPFAGNVGEETINALNTDSTRISGAVRQVFRPHQAITRGELAKIAVKILSL